MRYDTNDREAKKRREWKGHRERGERVQLNPKRKTTRRRGRDRRDERRDGQDSNWMVMSFCTQTLAP